MKIIYKTRFSYFGQSGWRSPAAADPQKLFEPARLDARLTMFRRYTLASLASQTDGDFHHVILSSSLMPERYKMLLRGVVRQALGARASVIFRPQGSAGRMFRRFVLNTYGDADQIVQVVLDDDDALSADFNKVLRYQARCVIEDEDNEDEATFLSFPRGYSLGLDQHSMPQWLAPRNVPYTNLGLAQISAPNYRKNPFMTAHRRIGERQAARVIAANRPFYLRAVHGHNDSRAIASDQRMAPHEVADLLVRFPFMAGLVGRENGRAATLERRAG